jgi:hypothetical protein
MQGQLRNLPLVWQRPATARSSSETSRPAIATATAESDVAQPPIQRKRILEPRVLEEIDIAAQRLRDAALEAVRYDDTSQREMSVEHEPP